MHGNTDKPMGWRLASSGPAWGMRFLAFVYRFLPLRLGQYLIWGMIWGWFQHYNHPRESVVRAMRRMGHEPAYWAAYRVFLNYGFMLVERFYTYSGRLTPQVERDDPRAKAAARLMEEESRKPGPLVVLSSHCGALEHTTFVLEGLGRNLRAVAIRDEGAASLLSGVGDPSVRLGAGRTIIADGSMRAGLAMLQALRQGDILAFKADRTLPGADSSDVVEVPVFGEPARLPLGPAKLIAAANARALVISVFRTGRGRYRALADSIDTRSRDPETIVREYVRIQEEHLREFPDQWFNFYPYWPSDEVPVSELPATVPSPLRAAAPALLATVGAILSVAILGHAAGINGSEGAVSGWPALAAGLLAGVAAAVGVITLGGSVDRDLRPNEVALRGAVVGAGLGALAVVIAIPGPYTQSLISLAGGAACFGGLLAWTWNRHWLLGGWLLSLIVVINLTL